MMGTGQSAVMERVGPDFLYGVRNVSVPGRANCYNDDSEEKIPAPRRMTGTPKAVASISQRESDHPPIQVSDFVSF